MYERKGIENMGKFDKVLIATDFDNTLVYTEAAITTGADIPPISARNRAALEHFIAEGGLFSVSTGRAMPAFSSYAADLPLNAPCVVANGAAIYDYRTNEALYTAYLDASVYDHMDELFLTFPDMTMEIYHADRRIHTINPNQYVRYHEHLTRTSAVEVKSFREIDPPIIKVLFEDEPEVLKTIHDHILAQSWGVEYELVFSNDHLLELTKAGASKGGMVLRLAEILGVERKDIYCIGDHGNDISMLKVSALSFAPENAIPAVLETADVVVGHCRDGALADMIEELEKRY